MIAPVAAWPPVAGTYATKLVRGGPRVAVRIYFGLPVIDGDTLDRSPRWCVEIDGRTDRVERGDDGYRCHVQLDVESVWPHCAKDPITEEEHAYLVAHAGWAREHAPDHPKAQPRKPVDFLTLPMRF